jgi:hypothetical protein
MVIPLLSFAADEVGGETVEDVPDFTIYIIHFAAGDPEKDGHSWNFSRGLEDDWGVCTVREIQRATVYEGIASFDLHRRGLACVFDPEGASKVGFAELHITFAIDDHAWEELAATAGIVFRDRAYFRCEG